MSPVAPFDVLRCGLGGSALVEASAGTGKTWNLCGLYLRLLLERGLGVQQLLVVTFTKAATAELRDRIRSRLVEALACLRQGAAAADPFVTDLLQMLRDERGLDDATMVQRIDLALQCFDEAAIFTIHGFCQRALADTPFSAQLPFVLEMVQDDRAFVAQAANDFWRRRVASDLPDAALAQYLAARKDSPQKYARLLARDLAKPLAQVLWPAAIDRPGTCDASALQAAHAAARALWHAQRDAVVQTVLDAQGLSARSYTEKSVAEAAAVWDQLLAGDDALSTLGETPKKVDLLGRVRLKPNKGYVAPVHAFFDAAQDLLDQRAAAGRPLALARLALLRELLAEGRQSLRAAKRERRVVGYDDMLFNLYERLTGGAAPWLAGSLRERYPAALVDEFQDTDPLQFAIFDAIYGGSEAPLFLVGDPKQAIYSFRSADLYTYLDAARKAAARYTLVDNQRASEPLIGALNGLFGANPRAFMLDGLDYRRAGFGARQRAAFVDRSEPRAPLQVWMLPEAPLLSRRQARARAIGASAAEIARLVGAGRVGEVTIGERSLRAGDIAVLVRSHAQGSEVRAALSALGVGSVELSQQSVFASPDAEDLERLLAALLEPTRESLLKAALATGLIGLDATALEALADDDAPLQAWVQRFADYRDAWLARGAGFMLRELMLGEHVIERMLARPDGERRLTNLTHLAECLQQAAEQHTAPDALLRWLRERRQDEQGDEAAQLRLESDQDLVQIVTIHKAKGLEYGIVFCPMLWDAQAGGRGGGLDGVEYHDNAKQPVIDFRAGLDEAYIEKDVKAQRKLEAAAEDLRLIYVALTRAVHRCVIVAGCYASGSSGTPTASARSLLNWLVAGHGHTPEQWWANKKDAAAIGAAWTALAAAVGPAMALSPLPTAPGRPLAVTATPPEALAALPPPRHVPAAWWIGSYSALAFQAAPESAGADHDLRVPVGDRLRTAALDDDDFLRFPRGAAAGDCVHAVFERVDFADPAPWPERIAAVLAAQGTPAQVTGLRARMLLRLLRDVTATPLPVGTARPLTLSAVPWRRRLTELEFHLPAARLSADTLNDTVAALGLGAPRLAFGTLHGYLKGFIDAVVEHDGRYFVVDWKSNHLGDTPADYAQAALADAMAAHGYHLQSLFYAVALDRLLRLRLPDYDPARHFGGALYLFVRGLRPGWTQPDGSPAGMHFHRLPPAALRRLSALFEAPGA